SAAAEAAGADRGRLDFWKRLEAFAPLAQLLSAVLVVCGMLYLWHTHSDHDKKVSDALSQLTAQPSSKGGTTDSSTQTTLPSPTPAQQPQVFPQDAEVTNLLRQMFGSDKSAREAARDTLTAEWKTDGRAIQLTVDYADANRDNKDGVVNTISFLRRTSPALLRQQDDKLVRFLEAVKANGPQTSAGAEKVKQMLAGQ
ncbi:MAG TPA: hypothetical protein VGB98_01320, partial [Pyrinomonadaceae bacterium]